MSFTGVAPWPSWLQLLGAIRYYPFSGYVSYRGSPLAILASMVATWGKFVLAFAKEPNVAEYMAESSGLSAKNSIVAWQETPGKLLAAWSMNGRNPNCCLN